jgi:hypothetical protein
MNIEEFWLWSKMAGFSTYYLLLCIFIIKHWNNVYIAACGGNGKLQPNEMIKLFCVFIFAIYCNPVIFGMIEFNLQFGLTLLGGIGVANLGKFKMPEFKINAQEEKEKD